MSSGINTFCFAASYAAALVMELTFLVGRRRSAGTRTNTHRTLLLLLIAAGVVAHTWYLGQRAVHSQASPLSSPYDWHLLAAWALATLYLAVASYRPQTAIGLFVLPIVLALVGAALFADQQPFAQQRASRMWGNIHGSFLLLGSVAVMAGFSAGLMYLVQSYRLKHKQSPSANFRLPSLEWLEKVSSRALALSAALFTIGFLAGVVLRLKQTAGGAGLPWSDPLVISSAAMLAWLIAAEVFRLTYRPARQGRKLAYLTVTAFLFLAVALAVMLWTDTQHSPSPSRATPDRAAEQPARIGKGPLYSRANGERGLP